MLTKQEAISACKSFQNVFEDYPFDENWAVMWHIENKKSFCLDINDIVASLFSKSIFNLSIGLHVVL